MININNRDVKNLSCEEIGALAKLAEFQDRRAEFTATLSEIANILGFCSIKKTRAMLESLSLKGKISMVGEATQKKTFFIKDGASVYHKEANRNITQEVEQKRSGATKEQPDPKKQKKSFFRDKIEKGIEAVNTVVDKAKSFLIAKDEAHEKLEKIVSEKNKNEFIQFYLQRSKEVHGENAEFTEQWAKKSAERCWEINSKNDWRMKHGSKISNLSKWVSNFIVNETPERVKPLVEGKKAGGFSIPTSFSQRMKSKSSDQN